MRLGAALDVGVPDGGPLAGGQEGELPGAGGPGGAAGGPGGSGSGGQEDVPKSYCMITSLATYLSQLDF